MVKIHQLKRQLLLGMTSSLGFLLAYLGFKLLWWMALLTGIAIYLLVMLLTTDSTPPAHDQEVETTKSDLNDAIEQCRYAAEELQRASQNQYIDQETATALGRMAYLVKEIGEHYQRDFRDFQHSRAFTRNHLPKILKSVNDYTSLSERAMSDNAKQRLAEVAKTIRGYLPHLQVIYDACLENDFQKLELQSSILDDVMKMDRPRIS